MDNYFNILVIGSSSQLAFEIKDISFSLTNKHIFTFVSKDQLNIVNHKEIEEFFKKNKFDIVINCAAYNAVDMAEADIKNATMVNHKGVENLARMAKYNNYVLIHFSTDYVFDGDSDKPYTEDLTPKPLSIYGTSKLSGENAILDIAPKSIIIRTSWLYSQYGNNFVKKIISLGKSKNEISVINDQIGSPTYAKDLANAVFCIINSTQYFNHIEQPEIFHYSNQGSTTWYGFAKEIFQIAKINCLVIPVDTLAINQIATRPKFSVLNSEKIKNTFNINIPNWQQSISELIKLF
jgi:dTDP-4-dehydrorhamnose reductase